MKSFKRFNEDAYAGRQGAGAWLTGKVLELGARGIRQGYKGVKALTSLASKKQSGEDRLWDVIHQPPDDVKKEIDAEEKKPRALPDLKKIKDIARDNIKTRGSEAVKGQMLDKAKNNWRDNKIREVIANTKKGSIERAEGLKGIPKAKKIPDPPKYKDK